MDGESDDGRDEFTWVGWEECVKENDEDEVDGMKQKVEYIIVMLLYIWPVKSDVFCIPDIYVIIVLIFYFFLEPALMGLCPSGFQPHMANKYIVVIVHYCGTQCRIWRLQLPSAVG